MSVKVSYNKAAGTVTVVFPYKGADGYQTVSKSGKSYMVASTGGNVTVDGTDGLKVGVNAFLPKAAE